MTCTGQDQSGGLGETHAARAAMRASLEPWAHAMPDTASRRRAGVRPPQLRIHRTADARGGHGTGAKSLLRRSGGRTYANVPFACGMGTRHGRLPPAPPVPASARFASITANPPTPRPRVPSLRPGAAGPPRVAPLRWGWCRWCVSRSRPPWLCSDSAVAGGACCVQRRAVSAALARAALS
jgi:hypothetical protein